MRANDEKIIEETIIILSKLMAELETKAFEQEGFSELTMRQVLYLETISRLEEPTFSDLAEALRVSKPSVTALVQKLMRLGYVEKEQSIDDRRVYRIRLTEKGERFGQMHDRVHRMMVNRIADNLDETEIKQMTALFRKVIG